MGISDTTLRCFMRYLRTTELHRWNTCGQVADTLGVTHHQARPVVAELVQAGLLERTINPRHLRGAAQRLTAYRVAPVAIEQRPAERAGGER
ncbi:hypothetical protein ACFYZ9_33505 [Streptomyces sp. NPDC001691]|uniref:hypothetical protein n=1 Tax=Streptomyces sp. NPDC001691 TaxID=3364600 RepID=UPI0036BF6E3C